MANWTKIGSSGTVEDRRGFAPIAGGLSITGVALVLLFNYLTGGDMTDVLSQIDTLPIQEQQYVATDPSFEGEDSYEVFASAVLGSNNETWSQIFKAENKNYTEPKLVLFRTATNSGCGTASSQVGPHYCPLDQTIYLDETFFEELQNRFGAEGGDVAEAYVIAHEVGHHIQNQLGALDQVHAAQQRGSANANELSIALELQADCYAGTWAYSIRDMGVLEPNEIQEAMDAAAAVGDDRIQQSAMGYSNPESWTHGSSEQRVAWFKKGYESGTLAACDTF